MSSIPDDVMRLILIRLPIKSLLHFRCVSKGFCALIDGPDFIKNHLNHSLDTKTNHKLLLQTNCIQSGDLKFDSAILPTLVNLEHGLKLQWTVTILGSVNGLICLSNNNEQDITIWNPTTRKYRKPAPLSLPTSNTNNLSFYYGFGHDSVSDDYKVLQMIKCYDRYKDPSSFSTEANVYSLRSNAWQKVQDCPYFIKSNQANGKLACGVLHWIVTRTPQYDDDAYMIAAFDLATSEFRLVDQPDFPEDDCGYSIGAEVLSGLLCVTCNYIDRTDVWVMNDYGVKESWSKLFSVFQPEDICSFDHLIPLAYSKDENKIMFVVEKFANDETIHLYHLNEEITQEIDCRGITFSAAIIYIESLFPIGGKAENSSKKRRRLALV